MNRDLPSRAGTAGGALVAGPSVPVAPPEPNRPLDDPDRRDVPGWVMLSLMSPVLVALPAGSDTGVVPGYAVDESSAVRAGLCLWGFAGEVAHEGEERDVEGPGDAGDGLQ